MDTEANVKCPFCGRKCVVEIDPEVADEKFVTDCDVCCRPFEIEVRTARGEILSLDVHVA